MNLAVIPARAGSKGLKHKNVRVAGGKYLLTYAIECAIGSKLFDNIVVTSDGKDIVAIGEQYPEVTGLLRSPSLGGDDVPLAPVVRDALLYAETLFCKKFETVCTLQPTSPLRTKKHVVEAYRDFASKGADSLLSVKEEYHSLWEQDGVFVRKIRYAKVNRQKVKPYYVGNGAIFITKRDVLIKLEDRLGWEVVAYPMSERDSLDIHTAEDLMLAEWYLQQEEA